MDSLKLTLKSLSYCDGRADIFLKLHIPNSWEILYDFGLTPTILNILNLNPVQHTGYQDVLSTHCMLGSVVCFQFREQSAQSHGERTQEEKPMRANNPQQSRHRWGTQRVFSMGRSQWNQGLELCLGVVQVRRFGKHTIWEKISDLIRQSYHLGKTNKHGITDSRKWCSMGEGSFKAK